MKISKLIARQIFDSRGNPTVECDVLLVDHTLGRAAVPSGVSTGSKEAHELRDNEPAYNGKGVNKALDNIRSIIAPAVIGMEAEDQLKIDQRLLELDGTDNKSRLGANAILAVSLASAKAAAASEELPLYAYFGNLIGSTDYSLPMPQLNFLNGGQHAAGSTDIQEFMIIPFGAPDFTSALQMCSEIYHALGSILTDKGYATTVGDEGGYAPNVSGGSKEAFELMAAGVARAGYTLGKDVAFAFDAAATELWRDGSYDFQREGSRYTTGQLINCYDEFVRRYPIISIEDGLAEDDWTGWSELAKRLGDKIQLVADDLVVTNPEFLKKAIDEQSANAVLIKPNQIGTLSETLEVIKMAKQAHWKTVLSHRSGETEDVTIAHLAVGCNLGQIKTGSFSRSERVAKYNELLRIAEQLDVPELATPFAGKNAVI